MDDIPGCNRNCWTIFHMSGGMHRLDCDLYPWQKQVEELKLALKLSISSDEDEIDKLFIDAVAEQHGLK